MPKSNLRNLSASEIVGSVVRAKMDLGDYTPLPPSLHYPSNLTSGSSSTASVRSPVHDLPPPSVTSLVFMGMGEPGYNYTQVRRALSILTDHRGLAISRRRITVSTSGVVPVIERLGRETGVNLAVSLHAVTDELRDVLVPINKTFPISMLLEGRGLYHHSLTVPIV